MPFSAIRQTTTRGPDANKRSRSTDWPRGSCRRPAASSLDSRRRLSSCADLPRFPAHETTSRRRNDIWLQSRRHPICRLFETRTTASSAVLSYRQCFMNCVRLTSRTGSPGALAASATSSGSGARPGSLAITAAIRPVFADHAMLFRASRNCCFRQTMRKWHTMALGCVVLVRSASESESRGGVLRPLWLRRVFGSLALSLS